VKKSVFCVVLFMFVVLFLSSSVFAQQQQSDKYKDIYALNVAPLINGGVNTEKELRDLVNKERGVISFFLGYDKKLIDEFYKQFPRVEIDEFSGPFKVDSMSNRGWDKKTRFTGPVRYVGKEKVESYIFEIPYPQIHKSYWFLTPKKCGNISLLMIVDEAEEKEEKQIIEYPSRISRPEREMVRRPKPAPVIEETKETDNTSYLVDVGGGIFKSCYKTYASLRGGFVKSVGSKFELNFVFGVHFPIDFQTGQPDSNNWKVVFTGDTMLVYRPSSLFLGAGVGMSSEMKNDTQKQFEGIGIFGCNFNKIDLFIEARIPIQKGERISENNKVLFGARFRWGK